MAVDQLLQEDQLSWALVRILEPEELLDDTRDQVRRLVEGCTCEWEVDE